MDVYKRLMDVYKKVGKAETLTPSRRSQSEDRGRTMMFLADPTPTNSASTNSRRQDCCHHATLDGSAIYPRPTLDVDANSRWLGHTQGQP